MPLYREDNYLVVHPGSQNTLFSFGLQDSLSPPQYKIPSRVFQDPVTKAFRSTRDEPKPKAELVRVEETKIEEGQPKIENETGETTAAQNGGSIAAQAAPTGSENPWTEIYPIQKGKIVNLDAFNYLLKVILQSVITKNPIITINQIPLLIISSNLTWLRNTTESVTKYVLESLEFPAFNLVDLLTAATFGLGISTSSCVVNIGHENTQIMPVINYQSIKYAGKYLSDVGGKLIDDEISKNLPKLLESQIEALKKSGIYEVVLTGDESSFYSISDLQKSNVEDGANGSEEDDDFDVAKLVADLGPGNEVQAVTDHDDSKPNNELEKNFFVDPETNEKVWVGKERFQGAENLISLVANAIYKSISQIPNLEKRQECFDNLIFVGSTFKIPGFKRALLIRLITEYLVRAPADTKNGGYNNEEDNLSRVNAAILAYQQTGDSSGDAEESNYISLQVPTLIKTVKLPDYFPEWKKPKEKGGSWEDVYFLGGEIYAKQIFGGNLNHNGEMFIDNDIYEEKGPLGIWDVTI